MFKAKTLHVVSYRYYRAIAKRFIEIKLYSRAMDYYLRAYESSININATTNSLIGISACCSYLSKYDEAINYYSLLLDLNKDVQPTYLARFGIALCNYKLKKFDNALSSLNELKEGFKTTPPTLIKEIEGAKALLLKALECFKNGESKTCI